MKVFISYAREDIETAKRLRDDLEKAGIKTWLDKEDLLPGQNWRDVILREIRESRYFIAMLSSKALSKEGFVHKELKTALDFLDHLPADRIFIIPVRIDECTPVDEKLQYIHWADLFPFYENGLKQILRVLTHKNEQAAPISDSEKDKKTDAQGEPLRYTHPDPEKKIAPVMADIPEKEKPLPKKQSIGIKGDAEKNVLVSGDGNVINIHTHESADEKKSKPETVTDNKLISNDNKPFKIPAWLTILVLSAIIIAGIIRFYPSEKKTTTDSSVKTATLTPTPTPDPPAVVTPPPVQKTFTESIDMKFVKIPAGWFMMGSPPDEPGRSDRETQHKVTISKPFFMQTTEVTQGQWKAVMGNNPSYFKNCGDDCPVENVSWDDVQEFIKKLNQKGEGTYRLPTEAEWEYAARGGTETAIYTGNMKIIGERNAPDLDPIAWYGGNSGVDYDGGYDSSDWKEKQYDHKRAGTHPAGKKKPNAFGLYDMLGNVWEWCQDWYGNYPTGAVTDPGGPGSGSYRVLRGGSWGINARYCRAAFRSSNSPGGGNYYGFRLVRFP